jgi:uracil-DNA glycosylase
MPPIDRRTNPEDPWVLVVLGTPTSDEDAQRSPYSSVVGRYLQRLVEKHWPGNIRYTYAVGCASGKKAEERHFQACRPHLWFDWEKVRPERVVLAGYSPIKAVTGRYVDAKYIRRGWAIVRGTPTFPLLDPTASGRNQFHKRQLEADIKWVLTSPLPIKPTGTTEVLTTGAEVRTFLAALKPNDPVAIDVENAGQLWKESFKLLCVGLCQDPEHPVVVLSEALHEARDTFTD